MQNDFAICVCNELVSFLEYGKMFDVNARAKFDDLVCVVIENI